MSLGSDANSLLGLPGQAALFYSARLSVRVSKEDLEPLLWEQAQVVERLDGAARSALFADCGRTMQEFGTHLTAAGRGMTEREQARSRR
jgi:hypothetical protein